VTTKNRQEQSQVEQDGFDRGAGGALTTSYRNQYGVNHAANETKDAITGRIIHTVNMMKEVL